MAQINNQLFTPVDKQSDVLTTEEEARLSNQESNPLFKSVQLFITGDITDFLSNGELTFNIPGQELEYIAQVKQFEYDSSTNYKWRGTLIDYEGTIVIYNENGKVFGHIVVDSNEYAMQTLGNASVVLEYDMEYLLQRKCGNEEENGSNSIGGKPDEEHDGENSDGERGGNSCTGLVRVLVLYTQNADDAADVQSIATTAIGQTNTGFRNSDVSYSELRVSKAQVKYLDFTETPDDIQYDVNRLANNSTAQDLRTQYQADLVVLLTYGQYIDYVGMARAIGPINSWAYAIVEVDYATANLTFAHETAHLFGARHQNDPAGTYQHGFFFTSG
ncbi:MAG: zinc-dependent metalloprotease [Bacteroidales bacterium]|nr:zinc-dependent metalloprotease [Bacteroidales bacterium]